MTEIIQSLSDISDSYDAVLCDLWGVYHNGIEPHAQAVAALRAYRSRGGLVSLLTNAPRPDFSTLRQLKRMGAPEDTHDVVATSGDATITGMREGAFGAACYHIGPERDLDLFEGLPIERADLESADFILCSGLFDDGTEGPEDYRETIAQGIARGLIMVCANPDIIVDRGERRLYCGGAIAQAYAQAGGEIRLYGKPHRPIYDLAMERLARVAGKPLDKARVLAIGDGPATDILGATRYGIDSLFVAGGLAAAELLDTQGAVREEALGPYLRAADAMPSKTLAFLR